MIITKPKLAEIITRQYDLTDMQRKHMVYQLSLLSDKRLIQEAEISGLAVYRLRAGDFTLNKLTWNEQT